MFNKFRREMSFWVDYARTVVQCSYVGLKACWKESLYPRSKPVIVGDKEIFFIDVLGDAGTILDEARDVADDIESRRAKIDHNQELITEWNRANRASTSMKISGIFRAHADCIEAIIRPHGFSAENTLGEMLGSLASQSGEVSEKVADTLTKTDTPQACGNTKLLDLANTFKRIAKSLDASALSWTSAKLMALADRFDRIPPKAQKVAFDAARPHLERCGLIPADYKYRG